MCGGSSPLGGTENSTRVFRLQIKAGQTTPDSEDPVIDRREFDLVGPHLRIAVVERGRGGQELRSKSRGHDKQSGTQPHADTHGAHVGLPGVVEQLRGDIRRE